MRLIAKQAAPQVAVGLTTCAYDEADWPMLDAPVRVCAQVDDRVAVRRQDRERVLVGPTRHLRPDAGRAERWRRRRLLLMNAIPKLAELTPERFDFDAILAARGLSLPSRFKGRPRTRPFTCWSVISLSSAARYSDSCSCW